MWAHAYQFDDDTATFIVECAEETWEKFGFGEMSQDESIAVCERIFRDHLDGHPLMTNARHIRGSAWINFPRVLCERWHHREHRADGRRRGDGAFFHRLRHQARARKRRSRSPTIVESEPTLEAAFEKYEDERRVEVLRLQSAARNSVEWFEEVERYFHLDPVQFNYSLLTRSQRISHENLRLRDKSLAGKRRDLVPAAGGGDDERRARAPMFAPFSCAT